MRVTAYKKTKNTEFKFLMSNNFELKMTKACFELLHSRNLKNGNRVSYLFFFFVTSSCLSLTTSYCRISNTLCFYVRRWGGLDLNPNASVAKYNGRKRQKHDM